MAKPVSWIAAMIGALAGAAASAEAPEAFCDELRRALAAAGEARPFESLDEAPVRLGFDDRCRPIDSMAGLYLLCHQSLAPPGLSRDRLAEQSRACLPEAAEDVSDARYVRLYTPDARIEINERGGPRAHVGRIVSLQVWPRSRSAEPDAPPG